MEKDVLTKGIFFNIGKFFKSHWDGELQKEPTGRFIKRG